MNLALLADKTPLELFRAYAFELKTQPDEVVQSYIDLADMMFDADCYGQAKPLFLALMAAHLMVIPGGVAASSNTGGNGGGPAGVKSIKEGDLQITYQDNGSADSTSSALSFKAWLDLSRFGQLIAHLRATLGMGHGIMTRGGASCLDAGQYHFPNSQIDVLTGRGI